MKKKQKINKAVNHGEWVLLGLTALFLCVLFALRDRPAPQRGVSVRTQALPQPSAPAQSGNPAPETPDSASVAADSDGPPVTSENASASATSDGASATPENASVSATPDGASVAVPQTDGRLNINTADLAALCSLPGIGESLAGRVIAYRDEHGPFQRPEDIMKVSGIGQGKFAAIEGLITTE